MKTLIIQGSPDSKSFCHANALNFYKIAKRAHKNVTLVDLSKDKFEPVLRYGYRKHMKNESYPNKMQKLVKWANHLIFFFPIWWSAEPSILKGWIERVLTPGFAYHYQGLFPTQLLKGRTAEMFLTCHAPAFFYSTYGQVVSRWKHFILGSCGIKLTHHMILGRMGFSQDTLKRRQKFMKKCAKRVYKL